MLSGIFSKKVILFFRKLKRQYTQKTYILGLGNSVLAKKAGRTLLRGSQCVACNAIEVRFSSIEDCLGSR